MRYTLITSLTASLFPDERMGLGSDISENVVTGRFGQVLLMLVYQSWDRLM